MKPLTAIHLQTALVLLPFWLLLQPSALCAAKTAAVPFLNVPASAQSLALGGNAVVSGSGMGGVSDNPALLGFIKQSELQNSYGTHLEGYKLLNLGYGYRGESFNSGVSVIRVSAGNFEGRNDQGGSTGGFSAADTAFNFSAAKSFDRLAGGVTFKYITSSIEKESGSSFALDFGAVYSGDKYDAYPYKIGVSVRNVGAPMKYISKSEALPLTAAAGLSVNMGGGLEAMFNVSDSLTENTMAFGFGMGLSVGGGVMLNAGLSRYMGAEEGGLGGLPVAINAGLGYKMDNFMLNYGFTPMGEMGNTQRMSLTFKFGDKDGAKEAGGSVKKETKKTGSQANRKARRTIK